MPAMTAPLLLRPLAADDLDRVSELESELFGSGAWSRAMYEDELTQPDRYYVAADDAGELVGYGGIILAPDAQVMTVGVSAAHRRRGIGTQLVADLVARARAARSRHVFLEVRAGDDGAQELYRRAGFEPIGTRRRYYQPDGEDAVVMRLTLRSGGAPIGAAIAPSGVIDERDEVAAVVRREVDPLRARAGRHGAADRALWDQIARTVAAGKPFRGRLVTETHDALGGSRRAAAREVGAAFELLHAGFLVHDDLIDNDTVRRGQPNLAAQMLRFGQEAGASDAEATHLAEAGAVLAGDLSISLAHRLFSLVDAPGPAHTDLQELLFDTLFVSVAGELGDVVGALGLGATSTAEAMVVAAEKTARYSFQAPLQAGAILADAPAKVRRELDAVGLGLGKAFQLVDDLLGVFSPEEVTGKSNLSDLREGKATTLIIHARTLPVWEEIRGDVGRPDIDAAAGSRVRTALARSEAPDRVSEYALAELDGVRGRLASGALPAALHDVVAKITDMVHRSLTDVRTHIAAAR